MKSRKAVAFPVLIGLIGLMPLTLNPRFELFHTVDVLQLLASGMCFGVGLAALIAMLRGRANSSL
jgi:hypothetical protein